MPGSAGRRPGCCSPGTAARTTGRSEQLDLPARPESSRPRRLSGRAAGLAGRLAAAAAPDGHLWQGHERYRARAQARAPQERVRRPAPRVPARGKRWRGLGVAGPDSGPAACSRCSGGRSGTPSERTQDRSQSARWPRSRKAQTITLDRVRGQLLEASEKASQRRTGGGRARRPCSTIEEAPPGGRARRTRAA